MRRPRASRLQRRQAATDALAALRRGDIITITHGRRGWSGRHVLESACDRDDPRVRWCHRTPMGGADLGRLLGTTPVGVDDAAQAGGAPPAGSGDLASALRSAAAGLEAIPAARVSEAGGFHDPELESSGCETIAPSSGAYRPGLEDQIRQAERYLRIERDNAQLERKVAAATNCWARTFDRFVGLLTERSSIRPLDPVVTDEVIGADC